MEQKRIKTKAGHELAVTEFEAEKPSALVIISPATGVKQSYYYNFAEFLRSENYSTFCFDFSGIGESKFESLKSFDTSAHHWGANDLEAVIQCYTKRFPKLPLILIGHSIGGQLIGLARSSTKAQKILLIAAQSGYWKHWTGFTKFQFAFYWYFLFPSLVKIFGYLPAKKISPMEDLPKTMSLEWSKWCRTPNYLFDYFDDSELFFEEAERHIISYSTSDDKFATKSSVDWLSQRYKAKSYLRRHLTPQELKLSKISHFGFFRKQLKTPIWEMMLKDIKK